MLNYLSFLFTAFFRSLWMGLFRKYDTIIVHQLSPVTVGIPAVIIKKMQRKAKLLFWVLDLWPESLQVAGGINNKFVLGTFVPSRIANITITIILATRARGDKPPSLITYADKRFIKRDMII